MIETALGLVPDAFNRRLRVTSPALPDSVQTLTIERLRVGDARVKSVFARDAKGRVQIEDVDVTGHLDVTVE